MKGRVKKEILRVQEKSNNLEETSPKLDRRRDKQIALGAKHNPKPLKKGEPLLLSCTCPMIVAILGKRQKVEREGKKNGKGLTL